ncbi:MAG: VanW family protein [Phycisphaerae bacterium]|nr:VanW family protein [Saprospiraceae bacterium]
MTLWKELKRFVRLWLRVFSDWRSGEHQKIARSKTAPNELIAWYCLSLTQAIRLSESLENKLTNLELACSAIDGLIVLPGEVFSFWAIVGRPSELRGFRRSRNIVKGRLNLEVGGGLCQVSSIVYQLALTAGLEVRERHAHSIDIYTEEERVAPLGADATVVYGYKDLRWVNPFPFPIVLGFEISRSELIFNIYSQNSIPPKNIFFRRERVGGREKVVTLEQAEGGSEKVLTVSGYGQL